MNVDAIMVEVQALKLKPGDILALRIKGEMTPEKRTAANDFLNRIKPAGVKGCILTDDASFEVVEAPRG